MLCRSARRGQVVQRDDHCVAARRRACAKCANSASWCAGSSPAAGLSASSTAAPAPVRAPPARAPARHPTSRAPDGCEMRDVHGRQRGVDGDAWPRSRRHRAAGAAGARAPPRRARSAPSAPCAPAAGRRAHAPARPAPTRRDAGRRPARRRPSAGAGQRACAAGSICRRRWADHGRHLGGLGGEVDAGQDRAALEVNAEARALEPHGASSERILSTSHTKNGAPSNAVSTPMRRSIHGCTRRKPHRPAAA